jgi:DNA end-binding protein Ku
VLHTLHHAAEIRTIDAIDELRSVPATVPPEQVQLAKQVIQAFEKDLDLATYTDEYRTGLQRILDAKIAGAEVTAPTVASPPPVVNLAEALTRSLSAIRATKQPPAKVTDVKASPKKPRRLRAVRKLRKVG